MLAEWWLQQATEAGGVRVSGLGFRVYGLGCLLAQCLVIHARMAPPHTRVCGWRHITCKATFVACVMELGETGSSFKPTHKASPEVGAEKTAWALGPAQQTRVAGSEPAPGPFLAENSTWL